MKCHITRDELYRLLECAEKRNSTKDPSWTRHKTNFLSDRLVNALGLIGEFAAAKVCGVDIDWSTHWHGDKGKDLDLPNKQTAAVKYNHRDRGFVMVEGRAGDTPSQLSDLTTDLIIGTNGNCDPPRQCECRAMLGGDRGHTVEVAGWLPTSRFMEIKAVKDWGNGVRHLVTVDQLFAMESLIETFPAYDRTKTQSFWISYGECLSCVTVDEHNRCAEVPPALAEWQWKPWEHLVAWAKLQGVASWGELDGDCLTEWREL